MTGTARGAEVDGGVGVSRPQPAADATEVPPHGGPVIPPLPPMSPMPSPSSSSPSGTAGSPFAGLLAEAHAPGPFPAGRKLSVAAAGATRPPSGPGKKLAGDRRVGPYRVLETLGSGGMAVVYKAVQPSLERFVAIKELRREFVHDRQVAARFAREAASLATLQHENIVHIYDYLYDQESAHIVMELVEGIDLFDLLTATVRLPPEVAAIVALEVTSGLEYAHYRGIVHRDIKPSNVVISRSGEVKLMDFGIARDPGNSELTQIGIAVGTPAYMAPEQIRGDRIDFRTDMFAVGILLYEMLTGSKPWPEEEGRSVTVKVLDEEPRPIGELLPDVPRELEKVIARCLRKDPEQRLKTTYELRRELEIYVHRVVPIDPRGRMVLFLRNRGLVSDAEAASFVRADLLADAELRRRDQGVELPPAEALIRPVTLAHAVALAAIALAGLVAAFLPLGRALPSARPRLVLAAAPGAEAGPAARARSPGTTAEDVVSPGTPGVPASAGSTGRSANLANPADAANRDRAGSGPSAGGGLRAATKPLTGKEGFVKIVVDPWARVFVDGDFYDLTPFADPIALPPGQHRLAFRNPYFKPEDQTIEVVSGATSLVKISLLPKNEGD